MIYTGQTYREGLQPTRAYDEMWCVMRYPTKGLPSIVQIHKELSPSSDLFYRVKDAKDVGAWEDIAFNTWYKSMFIEQLARDKEARASLNYLYKVKEDKDIILLCSCYDERLCHRSILKDLLELGDSYNLFKQKI